ncbi:MAG TPA: elongation factor Ts [Clostridiales bacterium]|nr:elongation factor Ts [Clostridia bacterium]HCY51730.1 elongation factor Ts [Clostridiales bacterium]
MYTMEDVKTLRERTGAGISDCSKALKENDGDMEKAIDYLREKGIATAAKKSGRIASEGICYAEVKGNTAVLLEVNCESDFVSKGDLFKAFAKEVAEYIFNNDVKDVEEVKTAMEAKTTEAIQKIGENIKIRRFDKYVSDNAVDSYIHMGGKIGVLVECAAGVSKETLHDVALQIAAAKPLYVKEDEVPADVLEKEKEILLMQIKNDPKLAAKPQQVIEKMVEGKIKKYYEENCLNDQAFVKDPSLKVKDLLAKENSYVIRFTRFEMGEGLEKKSNDFAAEVAEQMAKK